MVLWQILLFNLLSTAFAAEPCLSVQGTLIEHHDFVARESGHKHRILVIGQIHGDEPESGELTHFWIDRLKKIKFPSNHWRIIPIANPDGTTLKTRMNANRIDLNRNFPTKDWKELGPRHWREHQKSDPRRFPGDSPGSEPEVKCLVEHIENFRPHLIVSLHTPYGLFDFDGPTKQPISKLLPWKRLGTYPGSLGRWAWDERGIPVLTVELLPNSLKSHKEGFINLQDSLSDLVIKN